jgi:hypothetical protein
MSLVLISDLSSLHSGRRSWDCEERQLLSPRRRRVDQLADPKCCRLWRHGLAVPTATTSLLLAENLREARNWGRAGAYRVETQSPSLPPSARDTTQWLGRCFMTEVTGLSLSHTVFVAEPSITRKKDVDLFFPRNNTTHMTILQREPSNTRGSMSRRRCVTCVRISHFVSSGHTSIFEKASLGRKARYGML